MIALDDYSGLMPEIDRLETAQAEFLGALLYDTLKPKSVVDWGCASGLYLVPFRNMGCRVLGMDADISSGFRLSEEEHDIVDIRYPAPLLEKFDLALCIETAEHIQAEYADQLVENVANSADIVFWSAAHLGQGGQNHYNEQPPGYWANKFARHGFKMHPLNSWLKAHIKENAACREVGWLIPNARLLWKR